MKKTSFFKETLLLTAFVTTIFLLLFASCSNRQKTEITNDDAREHNEARFDNNNQEKDAQFIVEAAEINLKQIQLGQLAQQKGTTTHIKELGKMIEDAHTKSQRELTALAKRKSITIPTSPSDAAQDAYTKLDENSGNDFDIAYADKMVLRHKNAIDTFEKASNDSYDTDIKNWAIAALPDLRTHLNHSIDSQRKFGELKAK